MRRLIPILILMVYYSGGVVGASDCTPPTGELLRISVVFPRENLFGTDAADSYRGVQALVAALNACGGLNSQPVELVYQPASNYEEALQAVEAFGGSVPVVIGSGSAAVSEVLAQAAGKDTFLYWEVTEPLDKPHPYALSPRPNNAQLGAQAALFVQTEVAALLNEPLRVALVYEDNLVARLIAAGVRTSLPEPLWIDQPISTDRRQLAVQMREQRVNVVIVAAFERDADRLWYQLREADANLAAWVQVGGDSYHHNMCSRIGQTDGIISISAAHATAVETPLEFYAVYRNTYIEQFQKQPDEQADLAASGVLLLLRDILPHVEGDMSPEGVAAAAAHASDSGRGFMSEGWSLDADTWMNQAAVAMVAQQQGGAFCTVAPDSISTCAQPLQILPTWRERARISGC